MKRNGQKQLRKVLWEPRVEKVSVKQLCFVSYVICCLHWCKKKDQNSRILTIKLVKHNQYTLKI